MRGPVFYLVEMDPAAEALPAFADRYAPVHAAHLFSADFAHCTSCIGVSGSMSVLDIHQADDWKLFHRPAFERHRGRDAPTGPRARSKMVIRR